MTVINVGWSGGRPLRVSAALAALLALGLTACSRDAEAPTDPYAADLEAAKSRATSQFEKDVLADRRITRAEYDEANQLWLQCMHKAYPLTGKIQVSLLPQGQGLFGTQVLGFAGDPDARYQRTATACEKGTIALVGSLYNDMTTNPQKLSALGNIVACLKRHSLVGEEYGEANLGADLAKQSGSSQAGADVSKATSLDMTVTEVQQCISSPAL